MSDTERGVAADSLVTRPLPDPSLHLSAGYKLSAVPVTESETPAQPNKAQLKWQRNC